MDNTFNVARRVDAANMSWTFGKYVSEYNLNRGNFYGLREDSVHY